MIRKGEQIIESSEIKFMNLPPYVLDVDHVAKIRSELSITVLGKFQKTPYLPFFASKGPFLDLGPKL